MYIFLIIWFVFLFAYIVFNVYGLYRVVAMRIKGDAVGRIVLFYLIVMFAIIALTIFTISNLNWSQGLRQVIGI